MFFKCKNTINRTTVLSIMIILSALVFYGCPLMPICLDCPENVTVTDITSESAVISWTAVPDAASYDIMWTLKDNNYWDFQTTTGTTFKLTELLADEVYSVQVCAVPENNFSYCSSDFTLKNFTTPEMEFPAGELARPRHVTLTPDAGKTNVKISWDAVEATAYYQIKCRYIMRLSDGNESKQEKTVTVSADETSYTDTGINKYSVIEYCVAARDSDFSNIGEKLHWSKTVRLEK